MVRVAFISDIHFGQFSRTTEFSVPGEAIKDETKGGVSLKESMISVLRKNNVQYLFIAGDLTSKGSPQEFHYCEQEILYIAKEVNIPKENIILGLGNHDIDWKISGIYNNLDKSSFGDKFPHDLVKEKYQKIAASASLINMNSIQKLQHNGPAPFSGILELDDFVMFILNTGWCCTDDQKFSHGKLDKDQLEWFKSNAEKYKLDSRWKIVLMHHHPFNYSYSMPVVDISTLEEGSDFLNIAGQNGIHLVLHGHRHHPNAKTTLENGWKHPITFICAGSLAVNAEHRSSGDIPNMLHIIELTDDIGVLKLLNYEYSPFDGWFPIKDNRSAVPLDHEMMFGKLPSVDDINKSIEKLITMIETPISYEDLDKSLHFLPINDLNNTINAKVPNTHIMLNKFPGEVYILPKKRG
jgi:predicted phosphodiesterase